MAAVTEMVPPPEADDAGLVGGSWKWLVFRSGPRGSTVDKNAYTMGVLTRFHRYLKRRDLYAEASDRWRDPPPLFFRTGCRRVACPRGRSSRLCLCRGCAAAGGAGDFPALLWGAVAGTDLERGVVLDGGEAPVLVGDRVPAVLGLVEDPELGR